MIAQTSDERRALGVQHTQHRTGVFSLRFHWLLERICSFIHHLGHRKKMKSQALIAPPLLLLLLLLALVAISCHAAPPNDSTGSETADNGGVNSARAKFKLPSMFDFGRFKSLFHKSYGSLIEELKREKVYLSNAVKSMISAIKYKFHHGTHSLRVNQMSDWSRAELSAIYPKQPTLPVELEAELVEPEQLLHQSSKSSQVERHKRETIDPEFDLNEGKFLMTRVSTPLQLELSAKPHLVVKHNWHKLYSFDYAKWQRIHDQKQATRFVQAGDKSLRRLPDEMVTDHRDCFSPIRSQGNCGSCYAFAAVSLFEYLHCKETGEREQFSEQYIVDCGKSRPEFALTGCDGGISMNVASFVATVGLELRKDYPYYERLYECPLSPETDAFRMGEFRSELARGLVVGRIYMEEYLKFNPMAVSILVPKDFAQYGNGVHPGNNCEPESHHAMVLVGQGREDGQEYWLLRNSHSHHWGEKGYFKLNKLADCFFPNFGFIFATTDGRRTELKLFKNPLKTPYSLGSRRKPMHLHIGGFKIF